MMNPLSTFLPFIHFGPETFSIPFCSILKYHCLPPNPFQSHNTETSPRALSIGFCSWCLSFQSMPHGRQSPWSFIKSTESYQSSTQARPLPFTTQVLILFLAHSFPQRGNAGRSSWQTAFQTWHSGFLLGCACDSYRWTLSYGNLWSLKVQWPLPGKCWQWSN